MYEVKSTYEVKAPGFRCITHRELAFKDFEGDGGYSWTSLGISVEPGDIIHVVRRKENRENEIADLKSQIKTVNKFLRDLPESSAIEKISLESRKEELNKELRTIKNSIRTDELNGNDSTKGDENEDNIKNQESI